jgi:hypothetical protein
MTSDEKPFAREKLHTRHIAIEGYKRTDGLWDIEGHLTDLRTQDTPLPSGVRLGGSPLHEMLVRLTLDASLTIVSAVAETKASPYPGTCEKITPDYAKLKGVRIAAGFRREVAALFGNLRGCTHITELLGSMATAAMQTLGPELEQDTSIKPGKLDSCHALDTTGSAVAYSYPLWHRKKHALSDKP